MGVASDISNICNLIANSLVSEVSVLRISGETQYTC